MQVPVCATDVLDAVFVYLRQQGITVGVDQCLRVEQLLSGLEPPFGPEQLKTLLAPVLAKSRQDQEVVYRALDELCLVPTRAQAGEPQRAAVAEPLHESRRTGTARSRWWLSVAALLAAAALGWTVLWAVTGFGPSFATPSPTPTITPDTTPPPTTPSPSPSAVLLPTPRPSPPAQLWTPVDEELPAPAGRRWQVLTLGLLYLGVEWLLSRRARPSLDRGRSWRPPATFVVDVPAVPLPCLSSPELYEAARTLRRRSVVGAGRLDIPRSIRATVEARGYPSPVYQPESRQPEYLVLVDSRSHRDHQASFFQELAAALAEEHVFLRTFLFENDPRFCRLPGQPRAVGLPEILKRFPQHRLLMFTDGEGLVDPVTSELRPWVEEAFRVHAAGVLTPVDPEHWRRREGAIAARLPIAKATLDGLADVAAALDRRVLLSPRRVPVSRPECPRQEAPALEALRAYVGQEAFSWLAAAAVYPQLQWRLTKLIGSMPLAAHSLASEDHVLRLVQLPWFRRGTIGDESRLGLIDALPEVHLAEVRRTLVRLLETTQTKDGSLADETRQLDLAAQRGLLSTAWRERRRLLKPLQQLARGRLARDVALVRLLERGRTRIPLPGSLRRALWVGGIPAFGWRGVAWRAPVSALLLAGLWGMSRAQTAELVLDASPWAKVQVLSLSTNEEVAGACGNFTPCTLELRPGEYRVVFEHEVYGRHQQEVTVVRGVKRVVRGVLPDFPADAAADELVKGL